MDVIKFLINKARRVLPYTAAKAVFMERGTTVQSEIDSLRDDIQYYIDVYDPDYIERLATSARYAREQGWFANEQGEYIKANKPDIEKSLQNSSYAKQQGDYAKEQGTLARNYGEYIRTNKSDIDASIQNSQYAKAQGDYAKEYADYINNNKPAIDNSIQNSNDARLYADYAMGYKNYIDTISRRILCGSRIFNVPLPTVSDNIMTTH